jgi:hypothetical protein
MLSRLLLFPAQDHKKKFQLTLPLFLGGVVEQHLSPAPFSDTIPIQLLFPTVDGKSILSGNQIQPNVKNQKDRFKHEIKVVQDGFEQWLKDHKKSVKKISKKRELARSGGTLKLKQNDIDEKL